jgi:hypothetical protein
MRRKESQTQDPDSQTESGAPSEYFWFRTKYRVEALDRSTQNGASKMFAGHPPAYLSFFVSIGLTTKNSSDNHPLCLVNRVFCHL